MRARNEVRQSRINAGRRRFLKLASAGVGGATLFAGSTSAGVSPSYPDPTELPLAHKKAGIVSPEKTYRMMEWECHTPPSEDFNIDVEAAMRAAQEAGAEGLMFYAQSHWGYPLYLSDSAVRHPRLNYDLFGLEVSLARKYGISSTAYYSLQFNNQCVLSHPDWGWRNEKGELEHGPFPWYVTCLDSPYRQYVLGMMNELFARYAVQELFLDIFGIQFALYHAEGRSPFCFCRYTENAWNEEHPGDAYREGFETRDGWVRRYEWHQKKTMIDMLDEIIAVARKYRPHILVSINGGPESFPGAVMERVNFIYAEPLPCPTGIALGSILMRGWGRPYFQAGIFTQYGYVDTYPGSIPRVQADALVLQNARTFFVGNAPIISGLDGQGFSKRWFAVARETWEDIRNIDCLLGPNIDPLLSTGMLYSESTRKELDAAKRPVDFRQSILGALEVLTYTGRPVESLPEFRLEPQALQRFETLVLPEVEVLSDRQASVIREWVRKGGTLIASYKCGLLDENHRMRTNFPLADVLGVHYIAEDGTYAYDEEGKLRPGGFISTYLESAGHPLAKMLSVSTVGLPGSFLRTKRTTAEEVMRFRLPFMVQNMARHQYFNWGPPPPGLQTAGTAVAYNKFGEGQSLYLAVPIFWAVQWRPFWIQDWIPALIRQLVPNPLVELRPDPFSQYVHGTFFYDATKRSVLVQALNTAELATRGEICPTPKVEIRVDPHRLPIAGARVVWPRERDLAVVERDGRTSITLENLSRYAALYLRLR